MTIWFWGDGSEFDNDFQLPALRTPKVRRDKPLRAPKVKRNKLSEENYAEIEELLREALEWIALSHPTNLKRLMEAPEGSRTVWARGKRTTSEPKSDYDSWKPNYHIED
jgi:hypothetical protein